MERDRRSIEVAFRRSAGMSEEGKDAMKSFLVKQKDWYYYCKKCDNKIIGTTEEMKKHGESCK